MSKMLAFSVIVAGLAFGPQIGHAADAASPYKNINHQNDAGNDTGDSQVDKLNDMQLNKNYKGPTYPQGTAPVTQSQPIQPK